VTLRFLVLDAYDDAGRKSLASVGARDAGSLYRDAIRTTETDATIDVVPFTGSFALPNGAAVSDYDAVVWTGSNLTIHKDTPPVRDQLAFARAALEAGVASFGSCWAVHVAVTAAGGTCAANPKGRELGIARTITQTAAGRGHVLYKGRALAFDAFTSHEDHVVSVGLNTTILASNDWSQVQAVAVAQGRGLFWAVQYHPEFTLRDIAKLCLLRAPQGIAQGFFRDQADVEAYVRDLDTLHEDPARSDIAFRLGVGADLLDPARRLGELRRFIDECVKERKYVL
jgi:GMP synthase (glutamine-hydrolysing)